MKTCFTCKETKPFDQFSRSKRISDGHQRECKPCKKIRDADYYQRNTARYLNHNRRYRKDLQDKLAAYKATLSCSVCSEARAWCLAFHHPNDDKDAAISEMVSKYRSWDRILKEIEKCVVVCHNCHADIHYNERKCT